MWARQRDSRLVAWQKARALAKGIYEVTRQGAFARDYGLGAQIQRASSVMSNIAEGFERGGRGEFHQFLSTAKTSCAEVRSQLYPAFDIGYLDEPSFHRLIQQAEEVARIVSGLRASIQKQTEDGGR